MTESSYIGRCERLFCPNPAARPLYIEVYGRELSVCEECHSDRTSIGNSLAGTKRDQLAKLARSLCTDDQDQEEA